MKIRKHKRSTASPYQIYKKLYRRAEKRLAKRGMAMNDTILSKVEWQEYYKSEQLKNIDLKKAGKAINKNINRTIVASQTYSKSYQYAKSLKKALTSYYEDQFGTVPKEKQKQLTIRNIQEGKLDLKELDKEYWYLKDQGLTSQEAAEYIAGMYFGS